MAWKTEIYNSQGNRGGYGELPGSVLTPAENGWDTAVMPIATRDDVDGYFTPGDPHPDYQGLYVSSEPERGDYWRGDIRRYTVRFAGVLGFVSGMGLRADSIGAQRTERIVTADDYYGDTKTTDGYGGSQRRIISLPGGLYDAIRLVSLQPYSEKQFVTNQAPPTSFSLESLKIGATILNPVASTSLSDIGVEAIYTYPNGMLASSVRWTKHPSLAINLWLLDIRWEAVAAKEIA